MNNELKLFTIDDLKQRLCEKFKNRPLKEPGHKRVGPTTYEQIAPSGINLAVELCLEVFCEEINQIRNELRRKI